MTQEFEVSVEELLRTLKRRGIPLPSEMGAFITLEVCEQILDRPAAITTQDVAISEIGEVLCATEMVKTSEEGSVHALLALLGDLLVCSAPGVPSMLLELVERDPTAGQCTLEGLRDDLEACLLPLNRGATRRVLARLLREARKPGASMRAKPSEPASQAAQPSPADIDAQFDALLGGGESDSRAAVKVRAKPIQQPPLRTPRGSFGAEAQAAPLPGARRDETPITVPMPGGVLGAGVAVQPSAAPSPTYDEASPEPNVEPLQPSAARSQPVAQERGQAAPTYQRERTSTPDAPRLQLATASEAEPARSQRPRLRGAELDTAGLIEADPTQKVRGGVWLVLSLLASLALVAGYGALGREGARNALGLAPTPSESQAKAPVQPTKIKTPRGDLHVSSTPDKAQVLLLVGTGPAVATDLPLGVAQEFVAIADGYLPARAVVPADAAWEDVEGKPRYELAVQARPASAGKPLSLGATLLPQDVGTPQNRLGSVRVITTPKGAKVYQLVGFTPDVTVENLPLDQDYEVLVGLEGHAPVVQQLTAADFKAVNGKPTASVEVDLNAKK